MILVFYVLILKGEGKGGGETLICCSTYLCIHWLILVRALTEDQPRSQGYIVLFLFLSFNNFFLPY